MRQSAGRIRSVLVGVAAAITVAACAPEGGVLDPVDEVADPVDSAVVASVTVGPIGSSLDLVTLDVLGSKVLFFARARDASGASLRDKSFQWTMDVPGVVSLERWPDGFRADLTALAEGRVEITVSADGVEGTAVVDVAERARAAWSLPITGFIVGIAIGENGVLYVADTQSLHAVGPEGTLLWSVPSYLSGGTPAIAEDGTLYLGTLSDGLRAIDPDGNVLWVAPIEKIWSPSAIGPDGTIYQVNGRGTLYALDPSGRITWEFDAPSDLNNQPPAIGEDGTIYFGSADHNLYAIGPDGTERWRFGTDGVVRSPSIGPDGTIYFANDRITEWRDDAGLIVLADSRTYALSPEGTELWSAPLEGDVWAGPAIGFDGSIYMGTVNGAGLYVFAPGGSLLRMAGGSVGHAPIVASDGSIYRSFGAVSAAHGDGAERWRFQPAGGAGPPPAIGFDGRIYAGANVGGETNHLFAFEELDGIHGDYHGSPWPQERGDRQNSGRAPGGP